jgi:hypothetical protein
MLPPFWSSCFYRKASQKCQNIMVSEIELATTIIASVKYFDLQVDSLCELSLARLSRISGYGNVTIAGKKNSACCSFALYTFYEIRAGTDNQFRFNQYLLIGF